jgi:hypothetical protein
VARATRPHTNQLAAPYEQHSAAHSAEMANHDGNANPIYGVSGKSPHFRPRETQQFVER